MPRPLKIGDGFLRVGYRAQVTDIRCLGIVYGITVAVTLQKSPWCQVSLAMETKNAPVYIDFIRFEEKEIKQWVDLHRTDDSPSPRSIGEMLGKGGSVRPVRKGTKSKKKS